MVVVDALRNLLGPVDAQRRLDSGLFNIAAALSPDVAAQRPGLERRALMQEDQRRRQQLEDFYAQLAGGPSPSVQTAGMGGAGAPTGPAPPQGPAQGMQGLIAPPAAPAGQVDVFQGLGGMAPGMGGAGAAPMGNFMGAAPMAAQPQSSPASASPPTSPADTETLARRMIASGIPEIANQGVALLGQVEAQQARLQATAAREEGFFAPFIAADGRAYLPSKGGGPAQPLVDEQGNQLEARNPYDIRTVGGGVQAIDPLTGQRQTIFTPEEVGRGEGIAQAATQRETDRAQARLELPALNQATDEALSFIDRLAEGGDLYDGFRSAFGWRSPIALPASQRVDAESLIDQLTGRLTLDAAQAFKGAMSDRDIALAASAATRLQDRNISEEEARRALNDIRQAFIRTRDNLRRRAGEATGDGAPPRATRAITLKPARLRRCRNASIHRS